MLPFKRPRDETVGQERTTKRIFRSCKLSRRRHVQPAGEIRSLVRRYFCRDLQNNLQAGIAIKCLNFVTFRL
jgi:hypothetical protein